MKFKIHRLKSGLEAAEKRISELEDKPIEIIQFEEQREKQLVKGES